MALSLLAEYDEILRCGNVLLDGASEPEFLRFALSVDHLRIKLLDTQKECGRLMAEVQNANATRSHLERTLETARSMIDMEKKKRQAAETKVDYLENQLTLVRDLVWDGRNKLHDETRERLASVYNRPSPSASVSSKNRGTKESFTTRMRESENGLSRISEDTASLLSDLGYTRSEDELGLDVTHQSPGWRKHRRSQQLDAPCEPKKSRSSYTSLHSGQSCETNKMTADSKECLVATTTVTMSREGPVRAKSIIETVTPKEKPPYNSKGTVRPPLVPKQPKAASNPSVPPAPSSESEESMICTKESTGKLKYPSPSPCLSGINIMARDKLNSRTHSFCQKTMIKSDICEPCGKRIKFGKLVAKCRDCKATVHTDCKDNLPLPCVPTTCTPTAKGQLGYLSEYTPPVPPMIPALILHCIYEIEARGLKEVGIYRVPGSERDVKALKDKFLRGRGAPNLANIDIHVICGAVKDFLRSLRDPLIMPSLWSDFLQCIEPSEETDQLARLYQVVSDLPRPNRDTLAFLILHLQRVSECPECKMPIDNLAKVFGPTIVGYSSTYLDPQAMVKETLKQVAVMELMMRTPSSYWACIVNSCATPENRTPEVTGLSNRNPSSSSIHRTGFFNTPIGTFRYNCEDKLDTKSFLVSENVSAISKEMNSSTVSCKNGLHLSAYDKIFFQEHIFCRKTMYKCEICEVCRIRIKFGRIGAKCEVCLVNVHDACREKLPLPCVPIATKSGYRRQSVILADLCPNKFPMIPALLIHCFREIEARGMDERFLYQIPACEHDVLVLKKKFLLGHIPRISSISIHTICGVVKDFLLSLSEPLIIPSLWMDIVKCLEFSSHYEKEIHLFQIALQLKKPNKETLAFLILHLQRVARSPKCIMPVASLARLFGPTIIGFSSSNPCPSAIIEESIIAVEVMKLLLLTPSCYWNYIINLSLETELMNCK